ncbi:MAG: ATP-binding cassette domain-containing protein, partial [Anaerovoracaceae bacterium]
EISADAGSIKVMGKEITTLSNREIPNHRRNIGIVFQDFRLLNNKTVFENVAFAMEITHQSSRAIRRQVPQVLSLVGISSNANKYPDELSAGEQQRVAIARAIVNKPTVLIVDRMKKRVITIDSGKIVRDEFGAYEMHETQEETQSSISTDSDVFRRRGGLLSKDDE